MTLAPPVFRRPVGTQTVVQPDPAWPSADQTLEQQILALVNAHRASIGVQPLRLLPSLVAAAEWKSRDMAFYGPTTFNHDDTQPVARTWIERLNDNGYPGSYAAENIAYGYQTAQAALDGWLASPGHKQNLEGQYWNATGLGAAAAANGQVYWTQSFGLAVFPPGPTARQLADTALANLKLTTIGYAKWHAKVYKPASARATTAWQKALDALAQIT